MIAPTIDISPQKAIFTTQHCRQNHQNVIKIKLNSDFKHYGEMVIHLKFSCGNILIMEKYRKFSGKNMMEIFRKKRNFPDSFSTSHHYQSYKVYCGHPSVQFKNDMQMQ